MTSARPERGPSFQDRLDPEFRTGFAELPPVQLEDIAAARAASRARPSAAGSRPPREGVVRTDHDVRLPGGRALLVREYSPAGSPDEELPAVYWIHGGGHVMGTVDKDNDLLETLVKGTSCRAFAVEWPWAPENPYPASPQACQAGLRWLAESAGARHVDPARVVLGGSSSGGGVAAGLALKLRDEGGIPVRSLLLIYPMLDDRNETDSSRSVVEPRVWNRAANVLAWRAYLGLSAGSDDVSPYAAPARAVDLTGLPATFLAVGDLDLFFDEDLEFARRLVAAQVPTELHVYAGAIHGFYERLPGSGLAHRLKTDCAAMLARTFLQLAAGRRAGCG